MFVGLSNFTDWICTTCTGSRFARPLFVTRSTLDSLSSMAQGLFRRQGDDQEFAVPGNDMDGRAAAEQVFAERNPEVLAGGYRLVDRFRHIRDDLRIDAELVVLLDPGHGLLPRRILGGIDVVGPRHPKRCEQSSSGNYAKQLLHDDLLRK